jgi:hypothetical protein
MSKKPGVRRFPLRSLLATRSHYNTLSGMAEGGSAIRASRFPPATSGCST